MDTPKRNPRKRRGAAPQNAPLPKPRARARGPKHSSSVPRDAAASGSAQAAARRLTEIEIKLCYQEDTIEKLNQMILRQQAQIDWLGRQLGDLEERSSHALQHDRGGRDDPPPHY